MVRAGRERKARPGRWLLGALAVATLAGAEIFLGRPPARGPAPPAAFAALDGPLAAGAARVPILLPNGGSLAGLGPWPRPVVHTPELLSARALCLGPLCLVELDLLEIPRQLWAAVSARLPPGTWLWLIASHTHSGPGGYDPTPWAQLVGARRYDPRVFAALADAAVAAVAQAQSRARADLRLSVAAADFPALATARRGAGLAQPELPRPQNEMVDLAVAPDSASDAGPAPLLGELVSFGAHPTLVPRAAERLSADWPGAAEAALEDSRTSIALVVQGAGADRTWQTPPAPLATQLATYGRQVADAASSAPGRRPLAAEPLRLWRGLAPLTWKPPPLVPWMGLPLDPVPLQLAQLGDLWLVCLPGELSAGAWQALTTQNPALRGALLVSLCGDELSYVDTPEAIAAGRTAGPVLYPRAVPELAGALSRGLATLEAQGR